MADSTATPPQHPSAEEESECPCCGKVPDDPRVLRCLHSVCVGCLRHAHTGNGVKCVLCGYFTPCISPDLLPRDTHTEARVRRARGQKSCRACGQADATVYCTSCPALLCEPCSTKIHTIPIFANHRREELLSPHEPDAAPSSSLPVTPQQQHGDAQLRQRLREEATDAGCIPEQLAGRQAELDAVFDRIRKAVEERYAALRGQLQQAADGKLQSLGAQHGSLESMLVGARASRSLAVALQTQPQDFTLPALVDAGAHLDTYTAFIQSQRLDVDPCVDPALAVRFESGSATAAPAAAADGRQEEQVSAAERSLRTHIDGFGRIAARNVAERRYTFEQIGDHRGVLFSLGTGRGVRLYENPASAKAIRVAASSIGYGAIENIVSDGASDFCTNNEPYSWVSVELDGHLIVTHYSLHHDAFDTEGHFLRQWELQGFNPEATVQPDEATSKGAAAAAVRGGGWQTLSSHKGDKTVQQRNPRGSWAVTAPPSTTRKDGYKRLRIVQTGPNSNGNHYLMLSGLELYGTFLGV